MNSHVFAVVPVKETGQAKQRLAEALPAQVRQRLALAMLQDVLDALTAVSDLAGIMVVTEDADATRIACGYAARVSTAGARDGHTGAVTTAARLLTAEGFGMLAMPADIPLVTPADINRVLASHGEAPAFSIVPARDLQGSNTILCTPANAVPLRFGTDSYFPHLAAANSCGIVPREVRVPNIELDVDTPDDLAAFIAAGSHTRAHRLLAEFDAEKQKWAATR
jgi:2-phospho-L-lactate guanylyltransferase